MRSLLLTLWVFPALAFAQVSPCPIDTLGNGHVLDYSLGRPYTGDCDFGCTTNGYNCWQLADSTTMLVAIAGNNQPPFGIAAVAILTHCNEVNFLQCGPIGDPIISPFTVQLTTVSDMQVCVFFEAATTTSVGAMSKTITGLFAPLPVLWTIDSCSVSLEMTPARETMRHYLRFDTGLLESPPLRRGMYFELYEDYQPTHRKLYIVD